MKRRSLLEKKIAQELEKAKEYTKAQNKRGMPNAKHSVLAQHVSSGHVILGTSWAVTDACTVQLP